MKQIAILISFICLAGFAQAQDKSVARKRQPGEIWPGDSITILKPADGKEFTAIELYIKTRFVNVDLKWDSVTGEGFYEHYFTVGDFDAKPLPLEYSNSKVRVISVKSFRDKDNNMVTIFFCQGRQPNHILMVQVEKSFFAAEMQMPETK